MSVPGIVWEIYKMLRLCGMTDSVCTRKIINVPFLYLN